MVKVVVGVVVVVLTTAVGPPEDPEPPLVELVPGPPEGTVRSSRRSSRKITLRRFGDAGRRFTVAPRCIIHPVNRAQSAMPSSFRGPAGDSPYECVKRRRRATNAFIP
jgi:hypothetical protein